jgi:hypothetical protein
MSDPTALPRLPPPADDNPTRTAVVAALTAAGVTHESVPSGDVAVRLQGQRLFVRCTPPRAEQGQPGMVRVFGQWKVGDSVPADELRRLRAANDLTARLTVVKVSVHDAVLLVAADYLVLAGTDLRRLLVSTFPGLLTAVQLWHRAAGGAVEGGDASPSAGSAPAAGDSPPA